MFDLQFVHLKQHLELSNQRPQMNVKPNLPLCRAGVSALEITPPGPPSEVCTARLGSARLNPLGPESPKGLTFLICC